MSILQKMLRQLRSSPDDDAPDGKSSGLILGDDKKPIGAFQATKTTVPVISKDKDPLDLGSLGKDLGSDHDSPDDFDFPDLDDEQGDDDTLIVHDAELVQALKDKYPDIFDELSSSLAH